MYNRVKDLFESSPTRQPQALSALTGKIHFSWLVTFILRISKQNQFSNPSPILMKIVSFVASKYKTLVE